MRGVMVSLMLILGGCAGPAQRDAAAEARGYARGYGQAVKEQYWIIQEQQRRASMPAQSQHP